MAHHTPAKINIADINEQLAHIINNDIAGKELSSNEILAIMTDVSHTVRIMGWVVGYLLNYIETAIAGNKPGYSEYSSLSDWFDKYEEGLPFKRSMARTYKAMATVIDIERFAHIGPRKLNVLLKVRDENKRQKLIEETIKKNWSESRIRAAVNTALMQPIDTEDEKSTTDIGTSTIVASNMYELSKAQWNPFKGCEFDCIYCRDSFQRMELRDAHGCSECKSYRPHAHAEALNARLPGTGYMEFIFTCASGDISFCDDKYLAHIVNRIRSEPDKNFLLQSKNPATFNRIIFPRNVILGTTLETTFDERYDQISKAPLPSQRFRDFCEVKHPAKMVTLEPLLEFDMDTMISWIGDINPRFVWIGLDSKKSLKKHNIIEPSLEKVMELHKELGARGHVVMLKREVVKRMGRKEK